MRGRTPNTFCWTAAERRQLDVVRTRLVAIRHNAHALQLLCERSGLTIETLRRIADGRMPQRRTLVKLTEVMT